jgi:hypothetical protein
MRPTLRLSASPTRERFRSSKASLNVKEKGPPKGGPFSSFICLKSKQGDNVRSNHKVFKLIVAALVVAVGHSYAPVLVFASPPAKSYKNCSALNKDFKYGVSKNSKSVNLGELKIYKPKVNAAVYLKNVKLDKDRDGIVCEVTTTAPVTLPSPSPSMTALPITDKVSLAQGIWNSYLSLRGQTSFNFQVTTCAGVNQESANAMINAYKDSLTYWSQFYVPKTEIKWVLFSEYDYHCWRKTVSELEGQAGDYNVWNPSTNILGHCQINSRAFCGYGTGVKADGSFVQYNLIGSSYKSAPNPNVVHHEAVHLYQMAMESENLGTRQTGTLPPWFVEGQANLVGMSIAYRGNASGYRDGEIVRLKNVINDAGTLTAEQWLSKISLLELDRDFVFNNQLGYSLGWLILEKIYLMASQEKMHQLLVGVNKGLTWEQAILTILGKSKIELYTEVAEYLAQEVN